MSERDNLLNDKETQNTQLQLDLSATSTELTEAVAPVEKPSKKQAKKAKKAEKKAAKKTKKAEKKAAKKAKKAEKKAAKKAKKAEKKEAKNCPKKGSKKLAIFAWLTLLVSIACAVAPVATLLGRKYVLIENTTLLNGFFGAARVLSRKLGTELFATYDNVFVSGLIGKVYGGCLLVLPAVVAFTLILTLVASFSAKKSRGVSKFVTFINFLYFFCGAALFTFINWKSGDGQIKFNLAALAATGVTFLLFIICLIVGKAKCKKSEKAEEVNVAELVEENDDTTKKESDEALLENVDPNTQNLGNSENVCGVVEEKTTVRDQFHGLTFGSSFMKNKQSLMGNDAKEVECSSTENTLAYDWFLESLTGEERREFVSLFVYKNLPGTATLPVYVPGGDNYMFFRRFFLNLGKYRNHVSQGLLEKMYNYMVYTY